jgi:hypothetical protein
MDSAGEESGFYGEFMCIFNYQWCDPEDLYFLLIP